MTHLGINKIKVIIAGSRTFDDYELLCTKVEHYLSQFTENSQIEIVSGGAQGADALGERYAKEHGLALAMFLADWKKYGNAAGPIRNEKMAEYSDIAIIFWDGQSPGSKNMIDMCIKHDVKYRVINYMNDL